MRTGFVRFLPALLFALMMTPGIAVHAQNDAGAIRQVLTDQQDAWNRGDIVSFMHGYSESPDTTFIGKTIQRGYAMILDRYRGTYKSQEAMGQLEFSELNIKMLSQTSAVVIGHFHLTRSQSGGGDAAGVFSLVFVKESSGWKIIVDHTTVS